MSGPSSKRLALALVGIACAIGVFAQVPRVKLRATDGRLVDLAQHGGRIIVLAFGATSVPMIDKTWLPFRILPTVTPGAVSISTG
jgi:hypothetical protein